MNTWEFSRADGGDPLTAGEAGADYVVEEWEPFRASEIRNSDQDTPEGQVAGADVESGRPMSITVGYSSAADRAVLQEKFEALKYFFRPGEILARHQLTDEAARTRYVRCRGVDDPTPGKEKYSQTTKVSFRALDPHDYSDELTIAVDDAASVAAGGLRPTKVWRFVVAGPCTSPSFTARRADGVAFTVAASGLVLATGDRWEVDGRTGDVRKWVAATSSYLYMLGDDGAGHRAVVQAIQAGTSSAGFTSATGADTGTLTIRGCF